MSKKSTVQNTESETPAPKNRGGRPPGPLTEKELAARKAAARKPRPGSRKRKTFEEEMEERKEKGKAYGEALADLANESRARKDYADAEKAETHAERARIELDRERGRLIPSDDVVDSVKALVTTIRDTLRQVPQLVGMELDLPQSEKEHILNVMSTVLMRELEQAFNA